MRLAFTADLHWGSYRNGDEATRLFVEHLRAEAPDVLVLAGDVGAGEHFEECLAQFDGLDCRKALVPGNHDIWVTADDPRGDSLQLYERHLPEICARHHFHYLDAAPLTLSAELSLVGSMNWYDYSWTLETIRARYPSEEFRLGSKHFLRGRHNDARFVRWPLDDAAFTEKIVKKAERHIEEALKHSSAVIVVTHHPAFQGLSFPRLDQPPSLDGLLWEAFSGNRALEEVLRRYESRIPFVFCGHTHRARENKFEGIQGHNIGGDYHFNRALVLDWGTRTIQAHTFGNPNSPRV